MKFSFVCLALLLMFSGCSNVGKTAPDFKFTTRTGDVITSDNLKGKIVVLNVWATWCGTCLREIPALNKLYSKYESDTSVVFLAMCDDDEQKMDVVLNRFDFKYPQVANAKEYTSRIQTRLVKTYPQNLILDSSFKIIFEVSDGSQDIFTALDQKIQSLKRQSS
ncbi:MAG: TlpA family protein disulfide reductase [Bacteroidia bacterium]|nr:TlpA family protein disulfide reductase [Bacteroidia bacterium]